MIINANLILINFPYYIAVYFIVSVTGYYCNKNMYSTLDFKLNKTRENSRYLS